MTLSMVVEHLSMVVFAIVIAILIGVPLGLLCYLSRAARGVVLRVVDLIQTTPALALLGIIMVTPLGAGKPTVILGLALYSLLPIVRNVTLGLSQVSPAVKEAAKGMGMTRVYSLFHVELPLAMPMLFTGLRIAVVNAIGTAVFASSVGGGGLACGVSTFAKLYNPKIRVIGVEPEGAPSLTRALEAGHVVKLPSANTIADGTAVLECGDQVFPYLQANLDDVITVPDDELIVAFLDMVENHKMIVENSGLLTVAALKHLPAENRRVVSILSGGNMDVITMSSVVQHGLIARDRIFTVSVLLPDRPGMLVKVASAIAEQNGNVIKLEHNQFVSTNRNAAVELRVTIEAYGTSHKEQIMEALRAAGFEPQLSATML